MKSIAIFILSCSLPIIAQDAPTCPMHEQHMKDKGQQTDMSSCPMHEQHMQNKNRQADVEKRGDQAMGFPHDKTTHHFRLYADGGAIEVAADDMKDTVNAQAIRMHLSHIVTAFSNGDFSTPMFIHNQVPPGVPVMKQARKQIIYSFEELPAGGRIRIKSADSDAIKAIHDFLRFQIQDHATGDSGQITPAP